MKIDKETQEKLQEMQIAEQNLQNILLQKQAFQLELNEADSAAEETKKADDEIYRIIGQVMIKAKKEEVIKELEEKINILKLRIKSLDNQEHIFSEKLEKMKTELETRFKDKK